MSPKYQNEFSQLRTFVAKIVFFKFKGLLQGFGCLVDGFVLTFIQGCSIEAYRKKSPNTIEEAFLLERPQKHGKMKQILKKTGLNFVFVAKLHNVGFTGCISDPRQASQPMKLLNGYRLEDYILFKRYCLKKE